MKRNRFLPLVLPSLAGFLVLFIFPFFQSFGYAFEDSVFTRDYVGLKTIRDVLSNEFFQLASVNTLRFTVLSVPLALVLSVCISLLLFRIAAPNLLRSAFFLPYVLPSATIVAIWQALFSTVRPFDSLIVIYLWKYCGLNIMLLFGALTKVDPDMIAGARVDGASNFRIARTVLLPSIMPTLFFTGILSLVNSLKVYRESFLLYGEYPDQSVYLLQNFLNNHFKKLNYHYISAAALLVALVVYLLVAVLFRVTRKKEERTW